MARTKNPTPEISTLPEHVNQSLEADAAKHGELVAQRDRSIANIDARFGLDRPYERDAFISLARDSVVATAERMLVLGRACILLKEHEPKGTFGAVLEEIGIGEVFARKAMQAAAKFEGSDSRKLIAGRLSAGKLMELLSQDDDDLDALAEEGTIAGLTLDDVDRMSTRELRAVLRAERKEKDEELAAREDIIARKDKKIQQLEIKGKRLSKAPFREKLEAALQEFNEAAITAQATMDTLRAGLLTLDQMHNEAGENYTADVLEVIDGHARSVMALANDIVELAKA